MKTLTEYAQENRIHYRTAWNHYKEGKIPGAFKSEFGKILIPDERDKEHLTIKPEYVVCYARVPSIKNREKLDAQIDRLVAYCNAKGYVVKQVIKECRSGLDDKRPKLVKLLNNPEVTHIVVEHQDRLTPFGFNYIKLLATFKGCQIEVINEAIYDKEDLVQDFIGLVSNFIARLYGRRWSRKRAEKLIESLQDHNY